LNDASGIPTSDFCYLAVAQVQQVQASEMREISENVLAQEERFI